MADKKILAAALYAKAVYLATGDRHFHNKEVNEKIRVRHARELIKELDIA